MKAPQKRRSRVLYLKAHAIYYVYCSFTFLGLTARLTDQKMRAASLSLLLVPNSLRSRQSLLMEYERCVRGCASDR